MPDVTEDELCPSCGKWTTIDESYGWCNACIVENIDGAILCHKCNQPFIASQGSIVCEPCKRETFLTQNADRIEYLMSSGVSLSRAIEAVRKENRPICVVCNNPIKGAPSKDAKFCKNEVVAKKLYEIHRQRQRRRGYYDREEALRLTLEELNGDHSP